MRQYNACPECGHTNTDKVHTEQFTDMIEQTFICEDCWIQFTTKYSMFERGIDDIPANEEALSDDEDAET